MCVAPWQYSVFSWKRILVCFSIQWKICGEKKVLFLKNLLIEYIIKHYFFPSTPSEFQNDWLLSFPTWSFSLKYLAFDGGREKTFPIKFIDLFDLKSYQNSDFLIFFLVSEGIQHVEIQHEELNMESFCIVYNDTDLFRLFYHWHLDGYQINKSQGNSYLQMLF